MSAQTTVATLPESARAAFKEPLGPLFTDPDALLADAGRPVVAVGDVVTHHLARAGSPPDVAVVDGRSKRERVDEAVAATLAELGSDVEVPNEAGTLSAELVAALRDAVQRRSTSSQTQSGDATVIEVDGEEDLAAVPAVLLAPEGATVVYGQPGEGMVRVTVDADARERAGDLVDLLDVDAQFWDLID